jgi:hypothetical protein
LFLQALTDPTAARQITRHNRSAPTRPATIIDLTSAPQVTSFCHHKQGQSGAIGQVLVATGIIPPPANN